MKDRSRFAVVALALTAAIVRLVPLQWLHPLQWDEVEFFRATEWVRQGLVPYRDFWEHHTPLQWFVFAPLAGLTSSPGASAIVWMRWAQLPVWLAAFWFANALMRRADLPPFARWSAMAAAAASSMFMAPAIEYRIDTLGCALYLAGLYFAFPPPTANRQPPTDQDHDAPARNTVTAGALLCLAGFANLRLGPLLAATALLLVVIDVEQRRWRFEPRRALHLTLGVAIPSMVAAAYLFLTNSLRPLYEHVWVENYLGDRLAESIEGGFAHRLLIPFGIRVLGATRGFEPAGIDPGGVLILVLGVAGAVLALRSWRRPDVLFAVVVLQAVNVAFVAKMKFVYNYHLEIVVVLMLPLIALAVSRMARREVTIVLLAVAWCMNLFASVFRGKELDRAYQDVVMREVHARTAPGARVFDGVGWALRRQPAYRFWFLPDLARQLVATKRAAPYVVGNDLPAAVIADHNALRWLVADRTLQATIVRHYLPLWRNLWLPGLNARLTPEAPSFAWTAPADGDYRIYATPALATHPWFSRPLFVTSYFEADARRLEVPLGAPSNPPELIWRGATPANGVLHLRKGQRLEVTWTAPVALGVLLVPGRDTLLFRQPPPRVTLDGEAPRVTHIPALP